MSTSTSRSGFTLTELLVVMTILTIVLAQFSVSFVACAKLFHGTMANCELSLRMRELRDKLLFRMRASDSASTYTGLLSAQGVSVDTAAIGMTDETIPSALTLARETKQTHRLVLAGNDDARYLMDDHAPHDDAHLRWLRAGGLYLGRGFGWNDFVDHDHFASQNRLYLNLTVSAGSRAGIDFGSRTERLIVPVFGTAQNHTETLQ